MRKSGFTIIELLIISLVAGIIGIAVFTDITRSLSANRLEAAKWKFKSDIIYAQSLAVTQQANHGVIFNPANNLYSVYKTTTSNIVNDPSSHGLMTANYNTEANFQGVQINAVSFGSPNTDRLEFDSFGRPYSDAGVTPLAADGTVTLNYGASIVTITVAKNTGKVG